MGSVPIAWFVMGACFAFVGLILFVFTIRASTTPLRVVLAVAGASFALPGLGLLALSLNALHGRAVLASASRRDFLPLPLTLGVVAVFLGTWMTGSSAWWAERLHSDARLLKRTGIGFLVGGALAVFAVALVLAI